ncbi:Katanin p60 ATPase-containing subunit [Listeria monocytogenes N53-1]|nr:Katanin p60 ATPase-containing subunit [Listeria monocytogenes N53-1]
MKNTSPLSDVDSRYKYMRLATKALPSAKDIEIGDVENKKIDGFQFEFIRRKKTDLLKLSFTIMVADLF